MGARPSIRRSVLVLATIAVALVWAGTAVFVYFDARHEIDEGFDGHLAQTAALLAALSAGGAQDTGEEHAPRLDKRARRVAFQVWQGGRLLVHSLDAPDEPLAQRERGYSDRTIGRKRWRVFSTATPDGRVIHVGERSDVRDELARDMVINLLSPMLYALPVLALMLWLAVARGMRPLAAVTAEVSARDPDNLSPLGMRAAPVEVLPLVEQLNRLFGRIERSLESERQFTADAAHELRTPVAAIKAQAQVALAATAGKEREDGLRKVVAGCDRAAHLVDQLLVLARLDTAKHERGPCSLRSLAAQAVADVAPYAMGRNVSLELDAADEGRITGSPVLLHVLLRNLIDNAARYSPAATVVHIGIAERDDAVELRVVDQGPGIPEAERGRVFHRFYRALGTGEQGTGLGLSIVRRIAEIHGARVDLDTGPQGKGLAVSISFPRRNPESRGQKKDETRSARPMLRLP